MNIYYTSTKSTFLMWYIDLLELFILFTKLNDFNWANECEIDKHQCKTNHLPLKSKRLMSLNSRLGKNASPLKYDAFYPTQLTSHGKKLYISFFFPFEKNEVKWLSFHEISHNFFGKRKYFSTHKSSKTKWNFSSDFEEKGVHPFIF